MPYCPKCGDEYRPEIQRCADCDVELVKSLPDLMLVFPADQAEAVRQALQNAGIETRATIIEDADHAPIELRFSAQSLRPSWGILHRFQDMEVPEESEPNWVRLFRGGIGQAEALRAALEAAGIPASEPDEDVNTLDPQERATAEVLVPEEDIEAAREVLKGLGRIEE